MHVFLSELVFRLTFLLQLCVAMVASEKAISEFDVVGQIVVCRTQSTNIMSHFMQYQKFKY